MTRLAIITPIEIPLAAQGNSFRFRLVARRHRAQPDTRIIFSTSPPSRREGRGEEANVYKHEPLAPTLSPFGGERELFSFGAGIKMHCNAEGAQNFLDAQLEEIKVAALKRVVQKQKRL
jgi:hypothetical protein